MKIHHLNCLEIETPLGRAVGHCLLIENKGDLLLIDAGLGLQEVREPENTLGVDLVELTGFKLKEELTAINQIRQLGYDPAMVRHIICSHLDPDHIGGLADFPDARVHVSYEEYESFKAGNERYLPYQLSHNRSLKVYELDDYVWFGLGARRLELDMEIYLVPLFGHTSGHCGVALRCETYWIFYVGDAYYLRAELAHSGLPVEQLSQLRAVDNEQRIDSLERIRTLVNGNHPVDIRYYGYHDPDEFLKV